MTALLALLMGGGKVNQAVKLLSHLFLSQRFADREIITDSWYFRRGSSCTNLLTNLVTAWFNNFFFFFLFHSLQFMIYASYFAAISLVFLVSGIYSIVRAYRRQKQTQSRSPESQ